jgi:hypothetical protein
MGAFKTLRTFSASISQARLPRLCVPRLDSPCVPRLDSPCVPRLDSPYPQRKPSWFTEATSNRVTHQQKVQPHTGVGENLLPAPAPQTPVHTPSCHATPGPSIAIPSPFLEPSVHYLSHFADIHPQQMTKSPKLTCNRGLKSPESTCDRGSKSPELSCDRGSKGPAWQTVWSGQDEGSERSCLV